MKVPFTRRFAWAVFFSSAAAQGVIAQSGNHFEAGAVPQAEIAARIFQQALRTGDRATIVTVVSPDAPISEDGKTQTLTEYMKTHLREDEAYLKKAQITLVSMRSMMKGKTAQVCSESRTHAVVNAVPTALLERELLELKVHGGAWKITSVAWQYVPEGDSEPGWNCEIKPPSGELVTRSPGGR
jgi:hypothetical protein